MKFKPRALNKGSLKLTETSFENLDRNLNPFENKLFGF
jgi:hypothetical protein